MLENQGFFDIHSKISQRPGKIFQKFQKILRDHGLKRSFLALLLSKKYKRKFVHTFSTTTQCVSAEFHRNQEFFGSHTSIFHIFIFCKWKCHFWTFQNLSFSEHQTLFPNSKNSWTYSTLRQPNGYQNFSSLNIILNGRCNHQKTVVWRLRCVVIPFKMMLLHSSFVCNKAREQYEL